MSDVDRLVASLIGSTVPLERDALASYGQVIAPDVVPLADATVVGRAVDAIVGLGPIEGLVEDPTITDVLVNGPHDVWIERGGALERASDDHHFRDADAIVAMVRRVIAPLGLRLDHAQPAVDARLPRGARLHAVVPPAAVDGPIVAIRRFHPTLTTIDDLLHAGSCDGEIADRLRAAVRARENLLVAGSTGAGKTTLLNVLCSEIGETERVVSVEDAAELKLSGHVVRLEGRRPNTEGSGEVTLRELLRHALRLRPDRIVVGEVRGAESLDMLQALNTGHRGSMSTVHATGPVEALTRLETLASMAPESVPHIALRRLVEGAIGTIVMVERVDGMRRVSSVTAVSELEF